MNFDEFSRDDYADIFVQRGRSYDAAMTAVPTARDCEFAQIFARYPCASSESLIDVPSGGGYLQGFLQRSGDCFHHQIINLDFTKGFSETPRVVDPYGDWGLESGGADRLICLAALHHIQDLGRLLQNFRKYVRNGGLIHIADVPPGSGIAQFLDEFVNRFTITGHQGIYRSFEEYCWPAWLKILCIENRRCSWFFVSEEQMLRFCQALFGLDESARPLLLDALDQKVGIRESDRGFELAWELTYLDAIKSEFRLSQDGVVP